ncbi:hypothetical protein U14_05868 [Candidatus Moduliflexus flocculans]|uniref:Methyltransferase n=1 Tax=Candidatus Moduliflexus flocculans TaxID=1499966 RepID=A0A081BT50_9BACT|nr:hypothetical protein U14_05868 [Candidatus Moduliflexus flocculans]
MSQQELFRKSDFNVNIQKVASPSGYKGLAAFHKYWGKKPLECLTFLMQKLSSRDDIVLDPFLGSGLVAKESLDLQRRFIGIDINPFSIDLAAFFVNLPTFEEFSEAFRYIEQEIKSSIYESYQLHDGRIATHYLWEKGALSSVWTKNNGERERVELLPEFHDKEIAQQFSQYTPYHIRKPIFFNNSRVNSTNELTLQDIFTARALRNIDLLLETIKKCPPALQKPLLLTLTSSIGQMSKMVFAISQRHKTKEHVAINEHIEVGSWVIGYWRPERHFEINVWNCFELRAKKLLKALQELPEAEQYISIANNPHEVITNRSSISLVTGNCNTVLEQIENGHVQLIITDPPHSDRIPYLELSELWNAILHHTPCFEEEIVVSNAKERHKNKKAYLRDMLRFMQNACHVLKVKGFLAVIFNARDSLSWEYLKSAQENMPQLRYCGCFPMEYSARSVVQDSRKGALKHDFILIYQKIADMSDEIPYHLLESIHGWRNEFPKQ